MKIADVEFDDDIDDEEETISFRTQRVHELRAADRASASSRFKIELDRYLDLQHGGDGIRPIMGG